MPERHDASRSLSLHGCFYARLCWTRWPRASHGRLPVPGARLPWSASGARLPASVRPAVCACGVRVCGVRVCGVWWGVCAWCDHDKNFAHRAIYRGGVRFSVQEAGACALQSLAQKMLRRIGFCQQFNMGYACLVVRTDGSASLSTHILRFK